MDSLPASTTTCRATNDLDYVDIFPRDAMEALQRIAGAGSALAKKHRVHLQHVGVASLPESYTERHDRTLDMWLDAYFGS